MKVLLVADLHYTLPQFDWLQQQANEYDALVIAGDLLEVASPVARDVQMLSVLEHLRRLRDKTRLVVCSGNHDLTGRSAAGEKAAVWMDQVRALAIPCDGERVECDDITVSICPWWDGPVSQRAVDAHLSRDAADRRGPWVWVYHAPPQGSPTSCVGNRMVGDEVLAAWITQHKPTAVLCGHIHNAPFLEHGAWVDRVDSTLVFNPGRQIGPVPTHIVFDTERCQASWHSLMGTRTAALT